LSRSLRAVNRTIVDDGSTFAIVPENRTTPPGDVSPHTAIKTRVRTTVAPSNTPFNAASDNGIPAY